MRKNETTVRAATDSDAAEWNVFIDAAPESSPLARYEWCQIIRESYGIRTPYFIAERDGRIAGTLSAYETNGPFGERSFYSIRCGLIAMDAAAGHALLDHVEHLNRTGRWSRALVTSGWHRLANRKPNVIRSSVLFSIYPDLDRMWTSLRDKTRNMVRRAEKEGVQVVSGLGQVDILVNQYHDNMLRLGIAIHSRKFFDRVMKYLGAHSEILVAWHQGKPIASMLLHYGREVACYPFQNAVLAYRSLAPIQLLTWSAMKSCTARNVRILDMGESAANSPVFRSKVNFGGLAREIFYYDASLRSAAQSSDGSLLRQMQRVVSIADGWLTSRSPLLVRRWFAIRAATRGRMM